MTYQWLLEPILQIISSKFFCCFSFRYLWLYVNSLDTFIMLVLKYEALREQSFYMS